MSECVVRMDMPSSCKKCKSTICLWVKDDDLDYMDIIEKVQDFRKKNDVGFPDFCPIICSLPEGHGRLVDKDEAIESIRTEVTELFFNGLKGTPRPDGDLRFMWNRLEDEDFAPTIVPAERSE